MNISLNWLKEYVDFSETDPYVIAEALTTNSAEIERVIEYKLDFEHIVVGKVTKLEKHPDADKLKLCMVDDGAGTHQVVCGGSNLYEGMLVAFGKIGAKVRWHGEGDLIELKKAKIRGVESSGMICAAEEIGLGDYYPQKDEKEILDLSHENFEVGQPLAEAFQLDDYIFEVDNTAITHRADLFSHRGFALECIANGLGTMKEQIDVPLPKTSDKDFELQVDIKEPEVVPRYSAMIVKNVPVKESPLWLKKRIIAGGIRPINSHVDITNYVMLECGMPTHSFDLAQIKGKKVTLRTSKKGEKVVTLDGNEHELPDDVIVFEDEGGIFDLCGIMGGQRSGVLDSTDTIWFHAPVYEKIRIRRAALALAHRTDASTIYEKGVPVSSTIEGIKQGILLIKKLYPDAEIQEPALDINNAKEDKRTISLTAEKLNRIAGAEIPAKEVEKGLGILGFGVDYDAKKKVYKIEVPAHRYGDINIEEDLIEEIVRTYGINNIEAQHPQIPTTAMPLPKEKAYARIVRNALADQGFAEIYTYSFLGPELLRKCLVEPDNSYPTVKNYITEDTSLMRASLLPRLMETLESNLRFADSGRYYELSRTYTLVKDKPVETKRVTGVLCDSNYDFFAAKASTEAIFKDFDLKIEYKSADKGLEPFMHPARSAEIVYEGQTLGFVSEVHPQVLQNFGIKKRVAFFDLNLDLICEYGKPEKIYSSLPKYPSVPLDLNIVIPKKEAAEKYRCLIAGIDDFLIKDVAIIDEYTGEQIPADKRSITFGITYNAPDRTLTEEEVQTIHGKVVENLQKEGAELRS